MAFWSTSDIQPTRQFRFLVSNSNDDEAVWYWAKTVSKPSFEISSTEHQLVNHKFKYPGIVTWNDVNMTIVDTGEKTKNLVDLLRETGYDYPTEFSVKEGISKDEANKYFNELSIQQLDSDGLIIETWKLKGAFIKSINFGDLDYESEGLVTIQLTISYDWATFEDE